MEISSTHSKLEAEEALRSGLQKKSKELQVELHSVRRERVCHGLCSIFSFSKLSIIFNRQFCALERPPTSHAV